MGDVEGFCVGCNGVGIFKSVVSRLHSRRMRKSSSFSRLRVWCADHRGSAPGTAPPAPRKGQEEKKTTFILKVNDQNELLVALRAGWNRTKTLTCMHLWASIACSLDSARRRSEPESHRRNEDLNSIVDRAQDKRDDCQTTQRGGETASTLLG